MSSKIVKHHFTQTYQYSFTRENNYPYHVYFDAFITPSQAAITVKKLS